MTDTPDDPAAVVTLTHQLSELEVSLLRALDSSARAGVPTPVGVLVTRPHEEAHAYRRLVVLGLIEEASTSVVRSDSKFFGRLARITPAAERLLRTLSIENAHHFSPENPHETQR